MKKKLFLNTTTSFLLQICTVISGLIIPKLILQQYGSEVNGLVQSITQFLAIISFLELGIGTVMQSALYQPLAKKDNYKVNCIISSGEKFFKKIAYTLVVYVAILSIIYPFISNTKFDWFYIAILIIAISISSFAQYYFGIVDRILLNADQLGYIQYGSQILTLILNTIACVVLIKNGASIHFVKLSTSTLYLIRPFILRIYINKRYSLNRKEKYIEEPIKQKWNGVAQHIASVVMENTSVVILTIFAPLADVSIYSVYHMVIYGIRQLFVACTQGIKSLLGDYWVRGDKEKLERFFGISEFMIHAVCIVLFSCMGVLIFPFIKLYTEGINDANYIQPVFGILLVVAHAIYCLRLPYSLMILAAGHFKETQKSYIAATVINLVVSICTVCKLGLIGVAIGALSSILYQTLWMSDYVYKNIVVKSMKKLAGLIFYDIVTTGIIVFMTAQVTIEIDNFIVWILVALIVFIIAVLVVSGIGVIAYKKVIMDIRKWIKET